jgi:hypothetical protein
MTKHDAYVHATASNPREQVGSKRERKEGGTNNVFEFVVAKKPFEPIPIAAMI